MRYIVVGGGIIGLATARQLMSATADAEVVVLEREAVLARHQTAHNSGVVHAGIYYAPGSLKARLCRRGLGLLRDFCRQRGLPYDACGKVVVATDEREIEPLRRLQERATANGVPGLRWLEAGELVAVEPHASGVAGLHSPEGAIHLSQVVWPGADCRPRLSGLLRRVAGMVPRRSRVHRLPRVAALA
jgi:L-2-hydroxyglutarate oxidase LhgO